MAERRTVLVTGATGVIGPSLIETLLSRGFHVRALVRNSGGIPALAGPVELVQGDLLDGEVLRRAVNGVELIFHLAATLHGAAAPAGEVFRVNVEGARLLAKCGREAGVRRMLHFSTINVYGRCTGGEVRDERSPLQPESDYARSKAVSEEAVLAGTPAVVLRLAAVYGPRMKGNYLRLLEKLRRGRLVMVGDGSNRRALVHVSDVCDAALRASEDAGAEGQIFNVTDGSIPTLRDVIAAMCSALGVPPPGIRIPRWIAMGLAGLIQGAAAIVGKEAGINRGTVDKFTEDIAVSSEKIRRVLGFSPTMDLLKGWRDTVEGLKSASS